MDVDLPAAFDALDTDPVTIGVEEELFLVDVVTGLPVWRGPEVIAALSAGRFHAELPAAQVEHATAPCADLAALRAELTAGRAALHGAARALDAGLLSAGLHPTAARIAHAPADPHYQGLLAEYAWPARAQMLSALQVHVAVGPVAVTVAVHDALRSYLPAIAALAANAPFMSGEDTGLASARPLVAGLLPRQGIPPALGSWECYRALLDWYEHGGATGGERQLWWEVRLRPDFGTLEVRVADAQLTLADATAVAVVVAALGTWLASRARDGEPLPVHASERIQENRWRALRDGTAGTLLDLETGAPQPTAALVHELLDTLSPAAAALGGEAELVHAHWLVANGGAARQRALAERCGIAGLAAALAEQVGDDVNQSAAAAQRSRTPAPST